MPLGSAKKSKTILPYLVAPCRRLLSDEPGSFKGGAEPLGSALLAPLTMPLSSCSLTVRTTIRPLLLCKICWGVRMRLEGTTLALDFRRERHQSRCLLLDALAQNSHVFIFVHHFQVSPPGTPCDCFPLPLHFLLL